MLYLHISNRCWWSPDETDTPLNELTDRQMKMVCGLFEVKNSEELTSGMKHVDENFVTTIEENPA